MVPTEGCIDCPQRDRVVPRGEVLKASKEGLEDFVVHSPSPRVIETEGPLSRGEIEEDAPRFLVLDRDYGKWWATQIYKPSIEPIKPKVYNFHLI